MVLAFVLQILFQKYYLYIPGLLCNGIFRLCLNDSFFFLEPIVVSPPPPKKKTKKTRAGVCKTLCPQLPDSNTIWLQHCLAMTVTTAQIYDFNVILSKGNNSKIGDDWDKKKIRITYFFMRNQNMKFQNISIHGSKLMLYTIKQRH